MRKKLTVMLFWSIAWTLFADLISTPDANTLWKETGKNISGWNGENLTVSMSPENQNVLLFTGTTIKPSPVTQKEFPCSPEYPYLTFRMLEAKNNPGKYRMWSLSFLDARITQGVQVSPGYYVLDCYGGKNALKAKSRKMKIYAYNLTLAIADMKMVKLPDYRIETKSPDPFTVGDKLTFIVSAREEIEDVSIQFFWRQFPVAFNGQAKLQLRPTDKSQKVWMGEFILEKPLVCRDRKAFGANELSIRAVLLGGSIDEPVWSNVNAAYMPVKDKK